MTFANTFFLFLTSIFCFGQDDWKLFKEQNNVKLYTKNVNGSKLLQFRLETTITHDLEKIYKVFVDVENMNKWYDKVKSVKLLKKNSDTEAIYLLEYSIPMPFENRVSTIKASLNYDRKTEVIKVNSEYHPYTITGTASKKPLITILKSSWEITAIKKGGAKIIHSGYMDPGGNIPLWLTNEGVTSGPFKTMANLKKILQAS